MKFSDVFKDFLEFAKVRAMRCLKNLVFDSFLVRILVAMFILSICVPIDFKGHKLSSFMWFKTTTAADSV